MVLPTSVRLGLNLIIAIADVMTNLFSTRYGPAGSDANRVGRLAILVRVACEVASRGPVGQLRETRRGRDQDPRIARQSQARESAESTR